MNKFLQLLDILQLNSKYIYIVCMGKKYILYVIIKNMYYIIIICLVYFNKLELYEVKFMYSQNLDNIF